MHQQVHEDDGSVAVAPGAPLPLSFSDITGPDGVAGASMDCVHARARALQAPCMAACGPALTLP